MQPIEETAVPYRNAGEQRQFAFHVLALASASIVDWAAGGSSGGAVPSWMHTRSASKLEDH